MVKIILNGKEKNIAAPVNLESLIGQSCRDPQHVIAELNGAIVKNNQWQRQILKDGDTLELVNFVGGG